MSDIQTTTVPVSDAVAARHPDVAVRRTTVDAASTGMDADADRLWAAAHRSWADRSRGGGRARRERAGAPDVHGMTERGATMKGAVFGVIAMITVGSSASVLAALGDYPTFGGQAVRYARAAVILLILLRVLRIAHMRGTASDWLRLTLLAATGLAGFNVCYVEAVRHADPATVGAIIGGVPIVMAVLDPILRRRAPSYRLVAAAVVVSAGVAVMQGFGGGSALGLLWALGALAFVLWYSAVGRLGTDRAGLCAGIAPVSSVFAAWLIATGDPSTADLAGAVLVGIGVLVGLVPTARPPEAAEALTRRPIGRSRRSGL